MKILLIHQNFPGQFRHVALDWAKRPGWDVMGLGRDTAPGVQGVRWIRYKLARPPLGRQHPYLRQMEAAVLHGQAVARTLMQLKRRGYYPDVVLAHPGWGETMFIRDVYPDVHLIHFCEWFYGTAGSDINFDPEFPAGADHFAKLNTWNALHLLNLNQCDIGISPTEWQRTRHPAEFVPKIKLAHEGINTGLLAPDSCAQLKLPSGQVLRAGEPVITYVARNLEPYRGFHSFMRALELVQQSHRTCHAIIIGGDDVSYGSKPDDAANWREKLLGEVSLDPTRTHFLGKVAYDYYRQVLQVSAAHVYLTYPFVLSWSALEAMASGCLLIGSNTPPVQEVLDHERTGILVDFFDIREIAGRAIQALTEPSNMRHMREAARDFAHTHYSAAAGEIAYRALLQPA